MFWFRCRQEIAVRTKSTILTHWHSSQMPTHSTSDRTVLDRSISVWSSTRRNPCSKRKVSILSSSPLKRASRYVSKPFLLDQRRLFTVYPFRSLHRAQIWLIRRSLMDMSSPATLSSPRPHIWNTPTRPKPLRTTLKSLQRSSPKTTASKRKVRHSKFVYSTSSRNFSFAVYVKSNTVVGDSKHTTGVVLAEIVMGNIPVKNGVVHLIHRPLMVVDTTVAKFLEVCSESTPSRLSRGKFLLWILLFKWDCQSTI